MQVEIAVKPVIDYPSAHDVLKLARVVLFHDNI